jgi:hypothetical protein
MVWWRILLVREPAVSESAEDPENHEIRISKNAKTNPPIRNLRIEKMRKQSHCKIRRMGGVTARIIRAFGVFGEQQLGQRLVTSRGVVTSGQASGIRS